MAGATAFAAWNVPTTLTAKVRCQSGRRLVHERHAELRGLDAGVVDEHVDRADLGLHAGECAVDAPGIGQVGDHPCPHVGQLGESAVVAVEQHHLRARFLKRPRDAFADTAGAPGHDRDAAAQVDAHRHLLVSPHPCGRAVQVI
jgi:hypothetical protein